MKPVDWAILAIVLAAVGIAVFFTVRRRKRGGCSCGCDSCTQSACCMKKEADK